MGRPGAPHSARLADGNAKLAAARALTRPRARRDAGLFLAEGPQAVREALALPGVVAEIFVTEAARARHAGLLATAEPVWSVSERAIARLSETVTPQGIVAVCRPVDVPVEQALAGPVRLAAGLVEPADPGNAGTILRTADAAGAEAVIFSGGADCYGGKCVRASAGSLFHVRLARARDTRELIVAARTRGLQVLATSGAGARDLDEIADGATLGRPTLWLFGNEAHGLPDAVLAAADATVRVPIHGRAESLNLAAAAAVCLYASARAHRGP